MRTELVARARKLILFLARSRLFVKRTLAGGRPRISHQNVDNVTLFLLIALAGVASHFHADSIVRSFVGK